MSGSLKVSITDLIILYTIHTTILKKYISILHSRKYPQSISKEFCSEKMVQGITNKYSAAVEILLLQIFEYIMYL